MLEVRTSVSGDDFGNQTDLGHLLVLILRKLYLCGFSNNVIIHVQERGSEQFGVDEALSVGAAVFEFLDQLFGNDFAGLVMFGVHAQHFGFAGPVLHDL